MKALAAGGLFWTQKGAFAQALTETPGLTIGPYYPDRMPLDLDNDLLLINDAVTPALGEISWITGRVLDRTGAPVRGALVEIWQADTNGAYIHTASPIANRDRNFQGYGKFLTAGDGRYLFRTVKPGLYPGRTRHVHCAVTIPGQSRFTTQLFVNGDAQNATDGLLNGVRDANQRANILRDWSPMTGSALGELVTTFDIIMGYTPTDAGATATKPMVGYTGVSSAANHVPGVASGSWVSIYGEKLSGSTRTWGEADIVNGKLPKAIDGVSVKIDGRDASVYYVSPKQLNVLAPELPAASSATVTVTSAQGSSETVTVAVNTFQPAFFVNEEGYVGAAVKAGDTISIYGTGFGPTNPKKEADDAVTGVLPLANTARLWLDTRELNLQFAGMVSPGLYQFNFTVPDLGNGDHALTASVGGVRTEKIARLKIG